MSSADSLELRIHPPFLPGDEAELAAFLRSRGLGALEGRPDYAVALLDRGRVVGTGALLGKVVQGLAVDGSLGGTGLAARILSELEAEASRRGLSRLFVFTGPANRAVFESLGYRLLAELPGIALLLEKGGGLEDWLAELVAGFAPAPGGADAVAGGPGIAGAGPGVGPGVPGRRPSAKPVSALVMNCNPFTLGHLHLAETAAAASSRVLLLVVREEASSFPFEVRLRLVREGVAGLENVTVMPGSDYIVSRATFPTYFLKDREGEATSIHARLDATLFGSRVAPAVGVTRRWVAEEPFSPVTAAYNRALAEVLPPLGVELLAIPRLESEGVPVSASAVRRAIREGRLADARRLVPPSTWRYLESPGAKPVLERVAASEGRH